MRILLLLPLLFLIGCTLGLEAKSGNKYSFSLQPTVADYKAIKELR